MSSMDTFLEKERFLQPPNPARKVSKHERERANERAPEPKQITQPLTTPIGRKGKCRLALFKSYYNSIVLRAAGRNL